MMKKRSLFLFSVAMVFLFLAQFAEAQDLGIKDPYAVRLNTSTTAKIVKPDYIWPEPPQPDGKRHDKAGEPVPEPVLEKMIVFTANQEFLTRIYLLRMDGSVYRYFEYFAYRFVDLEVVNNELYAAEAFAPRVYRVDPVDGSLEVIIDDWSLFYFYGLSYDGTYFYLDEWSLRRYTLDGKFKGSTSYGGEIFGSAWAFGQFWVLNDEGLIQCWDLSGWPTILQVPGNHFRPPSPQCRGLWFDGKCFWSAESIDGSLGKILRFDRYGQVKQEWLAPAFQGWGVCVLFVKAD